MKTHFKGPLVAGVAGLLVTSLLGYTKEIPMEPFPIGIWMFGTFLLFGVLALVSMSAATITARFQILSCGSLLLGLIYFVLAPLTLDWWERSDLLDVMLFNIALLSFGIAGCQVMYRIKSPVEKTMLLVQATIIFLMPSLAIKTYDYYLLIPDSFAYTNQKLAPETMQQDTIRAQMDFTPIASSVHVPFEDFE